MASSRKPAARLPSTTAKATAHMRLAAQEREAAQLLAAEQATRATEDYSRAIAAAIQKTLVENPAPVFVEHQGLPLFTLVDIFDKQYRRNDPNPSKSFHEVCRVLNTETNDTYFYKSMRKSSKSDPMMYEVEAANGHLFKLFAPDCIPKYWAVYNSKSGCYTGVLVKGIRNFQPVSEVPLTHDLLVLDILKNVNHWQILKNQLKAAESALSSKALRFSNRVKMIPFNSSVVLHTQPEGTQRQLFNADAFLEKIVVPQILESLRRYISVLPKSELAQLKHHDPDVRYHELTIHLELKHPDDSSEMVLLTVPITVRDILNFSIIRKNCKTLVGGTGFADDDDHRGNRDREGHRIDPDMFLRFITYRIKENSLLDIIFRTPSETTFYFSQRDVRKFPELQDAAPFHQPTRKPSTIVDAGLQVLKNWDIKISVNLFNAEENALYSQLNKNKAFNFYTYVDFFRLCFFTEHLIYPIFVSNISAKRKLDNQNLVQLMTQELHNHTLRSQKTLCEMPEFYQFLTLYGPTALNGMIEEFEKRNQQYAGYIRYDERFKRLIISIDKINAEYQSICEKSVANIVELELKTQPELAEKKFKYLLKYILQDSSMLRFCPEFRADTQFTYICFDAIAKEDWRVLFQKQLLELPAFRDFIKRNGEQTLLHISQEWREWNQQIRNPNWANLQFNLTELSNRYNLISALVHDYRVSCYSLNN